MKRNVLILLMILLALPLVAPAQLLWWRKKKDPEKKQPEPKLEVAKVIPEILDITPVPQAKPANGSLYTEAAPLATLLTDFKARRVGDLVFIDVVEESTATVTSNASRSRDSGTGGGITSAVGALPVSGAATVASVLTEMGTRSYEGSGATRRNSKVTARITARVLSLLSNGDLQIQALKLVKINKETEHIALTGIIRVKDIAADNSISTLQIGDLRVEYNGKGIASQDNAPGWLYRFFDKINPF